jgi:DNA sulfur modification protein DndE
MRLNRLKVCQEVSSKLSHLKSRTGLNPNILCRIGFCLSLNDPTVPDPEDYPSDSDREIDRHTLTGQWDMFFVAMILERCKQDGIDLTEDEVAARFRAHVNRGVILLFKRIRNIHDLAQLLPRDSELITDNG